MLKKILIFAFGCASLSHSMSPDKETPYLYRFIKNQPEFEKQLQLLKATNSADRITANNLIEKVNPEIADLRTKLGNYPAVPSSRNIMGHFMRTSLAAGASLFSGGVMLHALNEARRYGNMHDWYNQRDCVNAFFCLLPIFAISSGVMIHFRRGFSAASTLRKANLADVKHLENLTTSRNKAQSFLDQDAVKAKS